MIPVQWFIDNGCLLAYPNPDMLRGIHAATHGRPCDGCSHKRECATYRLVPMASAVNRAAADASRETDPEVAARLGITKRQAAKMRQRGEVRQ